MVGPARSENDIVASIISYSLLICLTGLGIMTLVQALSIRGHLNLQVYPPETNGANIIAALPCSIVFRTSPVSLLPFYFLKISAEFDHEAIETTEHRVSGKSDKERALLEDITFPHRGLWTVKHFRVSIEDRLGLTYVTWLVTPASETSTLRVAPPGHEGRSFPVLSSAERPGDMYQDSRKRMGDPLDLKRYHPSDGLKKIVWKIFARAGELISRHPETSMTPEGQVIIFVIAGPQDDDACSAAIAYMRTLDELRLEGILGCDGMRARVAATSPEAAEELLIDATWDSAAADALGIDAFSRFIESCRNFIGDGALRRVVIFVPRKSLSNPMALQRCESIGGFLSAQQVMPTFALGGYAPVDRASTSSKVSSRLKAWFLAGDDSLQKFVGSDSERALCDLCLRHAWEVLT